MNGQRLKVADGLRLCLFAYQGIVDCLTAREVIQVEGLSFGSESGNRRFVDTPQGRFVGAHWRGPQEGCSSRGNSDVRARDIRGDAKSSVLFKGSLKIGNVRGHVELCGGSEVNMGDIGGDVTLMTLQDTLMQVRLKNL